MLYHNLSLPDKWPNLPDTTRYIFLSGRSKSVVYQRFEGSPTRLPDVFEPFIINFYFIFYIFIFYFFALKVIKTSGHLVGGV